MRLLKVFIPLIALPSVMPVYGYDQNDNIRNLLNLELEELINVNVVVTNDKETSERKAFGSIYKISETEWQNFSPDRVFDTLKYAGGIETHQSIGGSTTLSIRGYANATGAARGKSLLFDGIPLNGYAFGTSLYSKSFLPAAMLSSVEVAKGPMSSFYGPDAFHGAILLRPWQGENKTSGEISLTLADKSANGGNVRSHYQYNNSLSFTTNISFQEQRNLDLEVPNSTRNFDNNFQALSLFQSIHTDYGKLGLVYNQSDSSDFYDIVSTTGSTGTDRVESKLIYYKHDIALNDVTTIKPSVWYNASLFELLYADESTYQTWDDVQMGAKLHVEQDFKHHFFKYGIEYIDYHIDESKVNKADEPNAYGVIHQQSKYVSSAFVHYQTDVLANNILLDVGLRYDSFSSTDVSEVSPKFGVIWLPDQNNTYKLLYSEGYRAPAAGEFIGSGAFLGGEELSGENLTSLEFVYLYTGDKVRLHNAIFTNKWDKAIVLRPTEKALSLGYSNEFVNFGRNQAWGIESELTYLYQPDVFWGFANVAYTRSKNVDDNQEYAMFPRVKLAYGVNYQLANWLFTVKQLHKFDWVENGVNNEELPHYHETSGQISYQGTQAKVSLTVNNIFDKTLSEPSIWNIEDGIYLPGRNIALDIKIPF